MSKSCSKKNGEKQGWTMFLKLNYNSFEYRDH